MKHILLTIIIVFCSLWSSQVSAQSIPILTDPIKVREVELLSNRLDLTMAQKEAILGVYDEYLVSFARVKNGAIKEFEDDIAAAAETFGFMQFEIPERAMVEALIRKAQRAIKAIHLSDTLFFEQVAEMLSEKQRVELQRIKIARELEAYQLFIVEMLGGINNGGRTNLRSLFNNLKVESSVEIDTVLDRYDARYLKVSKEGFDAVVATIRLALDHIDELNVRGMDQNALMMRFMADPSAIEDLKSRGEILIKPVVKQAYELSQLNWKTWISLNTILDQESARKMQDWYFGKSFRDAVRGGTRINDYLTTAIDLGTISAGQKIDLQELQKTFWSKWSGMTKKHADVLESSRQIQTIAVMTRDTVSGFEEQLNSLKESRKQYIDQMESRIDAVLGAELVAELQSNKQKATQADFPFVRSEQVIVDAGSSDGAQVQIITEGAVELSEEEMEALMAEHGGDFDEAVFVSGSTSTVSSTEIHSGSIGMTEAIDISELDIEFIGSEQTDEKARLYGSASIPQPIAPSFPQRAATILELDESGELVIEAVYNEYREKYDEAYTVIAVGSKDLFDNKDLGGGDRMRKNNELNKAASEAVATLDTGYFDDLVAVTSLNRDDLNVKMLENHRDRQRSSAPQDTFGWSGVEGDTIDLVGLYVLSDDSDELRLGISDESINTIRKAMQGYHAEVSEPHGQFAEATESLSHLEDAMWLVEENNSEGRMAEAIQKRWRDTFTRIRDSKRELLLANQTVMESILNEVPEADFWKVRMEFVQKAYPDVFVKGKDLSKMVRAASGITSLDGIQKEKLDSLASTYRFDYWNLCEQMIENHQTNATAKSGEGFVSSDDVHRQLELETLRFQRKELNDRLQMRLRMILTVDQVKHVPGLRPTVDSPAQFGLR